MTVFLSDSYNGMLDQEDSCSFFFSFFGFSYNTSRSGPIGSISCWFILKLLQFSDKIWKRASQEFFTYVDLHHQNPGTILVYFLIASLRHWRRVRKGFFLPWKTAGI